MKIGIIGGSGLDDPQILKDPEEKEIKTPYGRPSSSITTGKIEGVEVCILSRHGKNHEISPSKINYRANIFALKLLGCTHIIATSAVGSLKEQIRPGDIVFPDQFIDFTKNRKNTYFDQFGDVRHPQMSEPYDSYLRKLLVREAQSSSIDYHDKATMIVIEGPRFSTRAESHMFRQFADVIGMTGCPEVILSNELEIPYVTIAMSTDYDCWKENEEPVTFEMVMETMRRNAEKVKGLLLKVIPKIGNQDEEFIKSKIRILNDFPKPGIVFYDVTTLLKDPKGMEKTINILYERYKDKEIDAIAGIESRGFIVGGILATKLGKPFVLIRKPGKLPSETVSQEYQLEYGTDKVEMHKDAINPGNKVLLVDDLLATGGTMEASANLIEKVGGNVTECSFIIELTHLNGRKKLQKWPVNSIIEFNR